MEIILEQYLDGIILEIAQAMEPPSPPEAEGGEGASAAGRIKFWDGEV